MNFTRDFSTFLYPFWRKYFSQYIDQPNVNYLEIGVFEGQTSFWILDNILTSHTSKATVIDVFNEDSKKTFYENLYEHKDKNKIEVFEGPSAEILRGLKDDTYDIIYIDGEHNSKATTYDFAYSWPLLKDGGYLIFDDYKLHEGVFPEHCRAQGAIDFFLFSFQNEIKLIHKCDLWVIVQKNTSFLPASYDMMKLYAFDFYNKHLFYKTGEQIHISFELRSKISEVFLNKNSYDDPDAEIKKLIEEKVNI